MNLVAKLRAFRSEVATADCRLSTRPKVAGTKELFRLGINLNPTSVEGCTHLPLN
jgi:hypothetical protein